MKLINLSTVRDSRCIFVQFSSSNNNSSNTVNTGWVTYTDVDNAERNSREGNFNFDGVRLSALVVEATVAFQVEHDGLIM